MSLCDSTMAERPFASTVAKYDKEHARGKVTVSNFPYHVIQSLPGYTGRDSPGLTASDVTRELARYLAEYAYDNHCPIPYRERDVAFYLWMQASRGMLEWTPVLEVVRANRKRDRQKRITHHFGHREVIDKKGRANSRDLIKLIRYVMQEGTCAACQVEFQYDDLTWDRTKPGAAGGKYELSNVTLMCENCNQAKGPHYSD